MLSSDTVDKVFSYTSVTLKYTLPCYLSCFTEGLQLCPLAGSACIIMDHYRIGCMPLFLNVNSYMADKTKEDTCERK